MARIRSIKPDMRRSPSVTSWPYPVRWTFVGLFGYLDDQGRGRDEPRLIKADLYPLDDDMTVNKLDAHLRQIAYAGSICRYEVDGRRYLHAPRWRDHQSINRPTPSKLPPCPIHDKDSESSQHESGTTHGGITDGLTEPSNASRAPAEQGTGNREQGTGNREQGTGRVSAHGAPPPNGPLTEHESADTVSVGSNKASDRRIAEGASAGAEPWSDARDVTKATSSNRRATRLPADWTPSSALIQWQRDQGITDDLARRELLKFRDYWPSLPGIKGQRVDWDATWRNWLRRTVESAPTVVQQPAPSVDAFGRPKVNHGW